MSRTLAPVRSAAAPAIPAIGLRGRSLERTLLLWNAPLTLLGAWGVAAAQRHPSEAFVPAITALGSVWLVCVALHLLWCAIRFDGDVILLPLLSLLFLIGAAFHLDIRGPASPGLTAGAYTSGVFLAVAVIAAVTAGGPYFKR